MKPYLLMLAVLLLPVAPAFCQAETPTPEVAQPKETATEAPTPPSPVVAGKKGVPQPPQKPEYPQWVLQEYPPWALEFIETHPEVAVLLSIGKLFAKPLIFVSLLLFVGFGCKGILRGIVTPKQAEATRLGQQDDRATRLTLAMDLIAWAVALAVASETAGLHWISELTTPVMGFLGQIVSAIVWLAVAALVAYSFSERGRDLVLSVWGWHYLRHHPDRPDTDQSFDLGDGKTGRIAKVEVLHTTFDIGGGESEVRPNAWIMKQHLHWGTSKPTEDSNT